MESLFWITTNLQSTRREYKNLPSIRRLGVRSLNPSFPKSLFGGSRIPLPGRVSTVVAPQNPVKRQNARFGPDIGSKSALLNNPDSPCGARAKIRLIYKEAQCTHPIVLKHQRCQVGVCATGPCQNPVDFAGWEIVKRTDNCRFARSSQ